MVYQLNSQQYGQDLQPKHCFRPDFTDRIVFEQYGANDQIDRHYRNDYQSTKPRQKVYCPSSPDGLTLSRYKYEFRHSNDEYNCSRYSSAWDRLSYALSEASKKERHTSKMIHESRLDLPRYSRRHRASSTNTLLTGFAYPQSTHSPLALCPWATRTRNSVRDGHPPYL